MTQASLRNLALVVIAAFIAILLSACESGPTARRERVLPPFESRMARTEFQNVRTTAYTHTESDHLEYSNRNALGGRLQAASAPNRRAENTTKALRALPVDLDGTEISYREPFDQENLTTAKVTKAPKATKPAKGKKVAKEVKKAKPVRIGSAAADWSRWPAGTTFRILSTGQTYRVDDYGWALAGRNTIDLYMANQHDMNAWGTRPERIQVLKWGDPAESLRMLAPRQGHPHIKRMILELQGKDEEAAALR